jgi:oligoribonuclease
MSDKFYIWFDTEYSDLELERAFLLQAAVLITNSSLQRILSPEQDVILTIRMPPGEKISPWVEQNLPDLVRASRSPEAMELAEADDRLTAYIDKATGIPAEREDQRPVLAGNSVHADWWLIRRFLPRFLGRLNYRHLDVTALKLEWMRLNPGFEFKKEDPAVVVRYFPDAVLSGSPGRHHAYYDLQASIAELAFYRRHLFR